MVVASALLALLVAAAFAVLVFAIDDLRESAQLSRRSEETVGAANQLERLVIDLETGQRGFVLTGEERFLEPWDVARRAIPNQAAALERLASDDPAQERLARAIAQAVRVYVEQYSLPLVEAARRDEASARSLAATAEGKRRVDELRESFDRFAATERAVAATQQEDADVAARRAIVGAAVGLGGSVLLILLFAGYLTRAIVWPIRRAADMAGRLAAGDLATRMPETGVGEIGALERAFNTMGASLETSRDELAELAAEQAALRRVATLVARGASPSEVFSAVAEEVAQRLGADLTEILRYEPDGRATVVGGWSVPGIQIPLGTSLTVEGEGVAVRVRRTGEPARTELFEGRPGSVADCFRRAGAQTGVGSPVIVEGRLWGVAVAASSQSDPLPAGGEDRIANFTELVGTAIANAESRAELTASRARIVTASDEARRRLERDLHDGVQQRLVSLALMLRAAQDRLPADCHDLRESLAQIGEGLAGALKELQEISRGIHPAILSEGGLGPALKTLARRAPLPVDVTVRSDARLPEPVEVAAYYVVAEALANVAKHSGATNAYVDVEARNGVLELRVRDDGTGGADPARGSGLVGLADRVEALGGTIDVVSPVGEGTSVRVSLPVAG